VKVVVNTVSVEIKPSMGPRARQHVARNCERIGET
jgi:hypothetical protein